MTGLSKKTAKDWVLRFWNWRGRNYVLILLFFAAWFFFLSPNTLFTQIRARRENREMKRMREFYQKEIEFNEAEIERFKTDPDFVETYGRENYLMKKQNEDIYLYVEE